MNHRFSRKSAVLAMLTLAWMAVIFIFSAQNGEQSSDTSGLVLELLCRVFRLNPSPRDAQLLSHIIRKTAHATEFGILALLWLALLRSLGLTRLRAFPIAFVCASAYAATDELHQLFVSDRAGQVTDWLIDSSGALFFLLAALAISSVSSRKRGRQRFDDK